MASPDVDVVDSVGAGDAFMSGLLAWLFHHDRLSIDKIDRWEERDLADALSFASTAASITCTRPGADPPRSEDLHP
jgi:fructokinase